MHPQETLDFVQEAINDAMASCEEILQVRVSRDEFYDEGAVWVSPVLEWRMGHPRRFSFTGTREIVLRSIDWFRLERYLDESVRGTHLKPPGVYDQEATNSLYGYPVVFD